MPSTPLTPLQFAAVDELLALFDHSGIWYRVTGGLAGNVHGSTWPLHDVDIDYLKGDWQRVERALGGRLLTAPANYADDEFRLVMATARIRTVDVELCQLEDAFVRGPDGWVALDADPDRRQRRRWQGRDIWTMPLDDLIAYKSLIGREADLRELRRLSLMSESARVSR